MVSGSKAETAKQKRAKTGKVRFLAATYSGEVQKRLRLRQRGTTPFLKPTIQEVQRDQLTR
jgi:hypothetical protein